MHYNKFWPTQVPTSENDEDIVKKKKWFSKMRVQNEIFS